jgi:hypothetical protein
MQRRMAIRSMLARVVAVGAAGAALSRPAKASAGRDFLNETIHEASSPRNVPRPNDHSSWAMVEKLFRPHQSDYEAFLLQCSLHGGYTTRVVSNLSWSPTYKAIASAKEVRQRYKQQADLYTSLREKIENSASETAGAMIRSVMENNP